MKAHNRMTIILALVLALQVLLSSACGGGVESEGPALEASEATQAPVLQAAEAPETTAPADEPMATVQSEEQQSTPGSPPVETGALVADLGFKPEINGFSFPNYGADAPVKNMTEVEMRRLFGDQVCALLKNDKCTLTPPAQQWLAEANKAMNGGHCEGFATLSLLMYAAQIKPDDFGGANAAALSLDNELLQREIAYWFITQFTSPVVESVIKGTPNDILKLLQGEDTGGETYTIGIYKPDMSGGHAITPFAINDKGGGIFEVLVYDNNYPKETRVLTIDSNANTWKYEASINPQVQPDLYEGDAETQTLELTPTSARLAQQACPFCAESSATGKALPGGNARLASLARGSTPRYNQIFLDGEGELLIMDAQGHRLGHADGKLVNEIPGARMVNYKVDSIQTYSPEPQYWIPDGISVSVTIDGAGLKDASPTDLVMIGPGFSIGVEEISLAPDQKDYIFFDPVLESIAYRTESSESPNIVVAVEQPGKDDYYFEVQGTDIEGGGTIVVVLDTKESALLVNATELKNEGTFNLALTRITDEEEESFTADEIALKSTSVVYVEYGKWQGNGKGLYLGVDTNGDGVIEDEYEIQDLAQ